MRRPDIDTAADAQDMFEEQQLGIRAFADAVLEVLHQLPPALQLPPAQATVRVLLERTVAWLCSMSKLDKVLDYQALSAGCRALLELAIDVVLITHDSSLWERMAACEDSQILKAAVKYREYIDKTKTTPDDPVRLQYVVENGPRIRDARLKHWGEGSSPGALVCDEATARDCSGSRYTGWDEL